MIYSSLFYIYVAVIVAPMIIYMLSFFGINIIMKSIKERIVFVLNNLIDNCPLINKHKDEQNE